MTDPASSLRHALPLFLLAGLCLSALDTTAKYLVRDNPLALVVWARYAGQTLVVTPFAWHRVGPGFWRTKRLRLHLLRSAFLLAATICFCNALYQMLTRKVRDEVPQTTLFYSSIVGTIGLSLALPWELHEAPWTLRDAALFLLLGTLAGLGHGYLTRAYMTAPASLLTPFTYLQIVWATAFGVLVFGQVPDGWSIVGMLVIAASGLALALRERRRMRFR